MKQQDLYHYDRRSLRGVAICYQWRGLQCMRAWPKRVHNPRTERQQANRRLFRLSAALAVSMKGALRRGMGGEAAQRGMRACNLFQQANKGLLHLGLDGTLEADWERLQLSMGRLAVPDFGETVVEADRLSVPVAGKMAGGRRVCLYAYCPAAAQGVMAVAAGSTTMTIQLPAAWQGCEVHVFGFAFDANGNASSTVYLTRIQANERVSDNIWGIPRESGISAGNDWSNDYQSLECDAVRASNIGSQPVKRLATVIKPRWGFAFQPIFF